MRHKYHFIMQYVWLIVTFFVLVSTTWMAFQDGFERWWFMYFFLVITAIQFLRHRWQYKKMSNEMQSEKTEAQE